MLSTVCVVIVVCVCVIRVCVVTVVCVCVCLPAAYSHSEADVLSQSLLEANIATEVCLTVLDTLSIFIMGFKVTHTHTH